MSDNINDVGDLPSPSVSGGWQQSGPLQPFGSTTKGVQLQSAQFPKAGQYTVQFAVTPPQNLPPLAGGASYPPIFIEALLTWSVAGGSITRRVSVSNGMSISGVGEGITVVITDRSPQFGVAPYVGPLYAPYPADTQYTVQATVAPGTRATSRIQPFLTRHEWQNIALIKSATFLVEIPTDAGAIDAFVSLRSPPLGPGGYTIVTEADFQVDQVVAPSSIAVQAFYPRELNWYPLVPGCTALNLVNSTNASAVELFASVFIGIDG